MISNELLRKKILDSAIQGNLVHNDNSLKPVDVDGIKDNIPFEVPSNWKWCHLKNVATCKTGNSINDKEKREKYSDIDCDGLFYIATKDVEQDNSINYLNGIKISNEFLSKFKIAKKDSALICIEGGSAGKKVGFVNQEVCYVNKLCNIYSETINNKYIYYFLQSSFFINEFSSKKTGIIGGVSVKNLENLLIPIPPIKEQENIVNKLELIFDLIDKKEKNDKAKSKFKEVLKEKILDSAIHGTLIQNNCSLKSFCGTSIKDNFPFEVPSNWKWCELQYITDILGDGIHGTPIYSDDGDYYFINGNNLYNKDIIIKDGTKRVSTSEYEKYKKKLNDRTILVSINGTLGNVAFYSGEKIILGKSACYFNLINDINKEYVYWFLNTKYFIDYITSESTGTTIRNVSLKTMRELAIPIPPLEEQNRIVERIENLFELIEQL